MTTPEGGIIIPDALLKEFMKEKRLIFPDETHGLFPVPIELIRNEAFLNSLLKDKEFTANFELAIVAKRR